MPELAEVETVRRVIERALLGKVIHQAEFVEDLIVCKGLPSAYFESEVIGAKVIGTGRKGKFWWINLEDRKSIVGHLGMAGWIRELGAPTARLKEHGKKPLDDENGRPRFLKMSLSAADGATIAMTDGRRLARLWLAEEPERCPNIAALGPDVYNSPYSPDQLHAILSKRKAPMKALLLNQSLFAGVGNWLADEVLYQTRISPYRLGSEMKPSEAKLLLKNLRQIIEVAIDAGADENLFPQEWLFHRRWGGAKGADEINGRPLQRDEVGGRTTAWVPKLQK